MRLLDTTSLQLREFAADIPSYAILSHTWGNEEVTYQELTETHRHPNSPESLIILRRKGYRKIIDFCRQARADDFEWAWADTCCIDKTSSAELSEAINSMYKWYSNSSVCYVYLQDVDPQPAGWHLSPSNWESIKNSRWFGRGWTLQGLIAPDIVKFYDSGWAYRGTKADLRYEIASITNIAQSVLSNSEELSTIPVARKMSWAARRVTTRLEDAAYSLLGIFGVNLPLIYGEGARAFIRLQEAIANSSNDLSLFAWSEDEQSPRPQTYYGVLAQTPRQFASCSQLELIADPLRYESFSFTITNRGVEFQTCLNMDYKKGDY